MNTNDGGWAFPWQYVDDGRPAEIHFGMSLRDYFAAKAMPVLVQIDNTETTNHRPEWVAGEAYRMADAMLKARQS